MHINTYPFSNNWQLQSWYRAEQLKPESTEIEISDNLHGYIGALGAVHGDGAIEGDTSFCEYSSWLHARKHGDTLQTYRITPVSWSRLELGVADITTSLLLVARRPFVVIEKFTHWFDNPRRTYTSRHQSKALSLLRPRIEKITK